MRDSMEKMSRNTFNYDAAFSRNIGWITEWEQAALRQKSVAIAGMGGVGGAHLMTLARLGIGGFRIADLDQFEVANLNRQFGANISALGRSKVDVMAAMVRDVNPEVSVAVFGNGVREDNVDAFLSDADLFIDGLDFFAIDIRRKVFARCAELGIPAITAAPIGFGTAYLIFMPGGMPFEDYFRFEGLPEQRQYVNFALGLTPKGFHRSYLVDPSRLDLRGHRGPSTVAAVQLCAGVTAAEAAKIMLGRGKLYAAPWYHQFDAWRGRWARGRLRFGNAGPVQCLKRQIGYRAFERLSQRARPREEPVDGSEIERILDLARWAPSGDNTQPWRFEICDEDEVVVHVGVDADNIYEFADGRPTLLSAGFLLETIRIAASRFGRGADWSYLGREGGTHRIMVRMPRRKGITEDPLADYIPIRSVDRRPYRISPLSAEQKATLAAALGDGLRVTWHENRAERWRQARINASATDIRLRLREAYDVHRRIIDWDANFSRTGVPAAAIGLGPGALPLMRWVMGSWGRVRFFNRFLMGTLLPRIELDLVPGLRCAAHFTITRVDPGGPWTPEETIQAGSALQRFWLNATRMGLVMQPALAAQCFAHYAFEGAPFTEDASVRGKAAELRSQLKEAVGHDVPGIVFRGRIGGRRAESSWGRSLRLPANVSVFAAQKKTSPGTGPGEITEIEEPIERAIKPPAKSPGASTD